MEGFSHRFASCRNSLELFLSGGGTLDGSLAGKSGPNVDSDMSLIKLRFTGTSGQVKKGGH